MEQDDEKGPRVGSPDEISLSESQVQVVIYDEEDEPPEAHAIPIDATPLTEDDDDKETETRTDPSPSEAAHPTVQLSTGSRPNNADVREDGFDCLLCGDTRLRRLRPGFHLSFSLCGSTFVDLQDSVLPAGSTITIFTLRLCGNTKVLVPPGTRVVVRRMLLFGNRDIDVEDDPAQDPAQPAPRLVVYIFSLCGDIRARSNRVDAGDDFFR